MKTPATIKSEPIHFSNHPGSRKICTVLWPRFSGFHEACEILKVSPLHVRQHPLGKLNGRFIQHCPVVVSPAAVETLSVLLNAAGASLPSLRATSKSSNSSPIGSAIVRQP